MRKNFILFSRWAKMLTGKSYYYILGNAFTINKLNGYFNDLTGKADWKGLLDRDGVPIVQLIDGSTCYCPTTIIQKAFGHYDKYIFSGGWKRT